MTKEIRQGAGLICIGLVFLVLTLATEGQTMAVMRVGAVLFGLCGLVLMAVGLLRTPSSS